MSTSQVLTIQKACKLYGVRSDTLRRWADSGHIHSWRSPNNTRMFRSTDLETFFNSPRIENNKLRKKIVYARVSSLKQRDDLQRQIDLLTQHYPNHIVIQDIGSGINFKRKGLRSLLDACMSGEVEEVVVAHKDRLCRFGFELFHYIITKQGGKIIVLDEENNKSTNEELAEDLLSIIHVFNCRQMGRRRYNKSVESSNISDDETENDIS